MATVLTEPKAPPTPEQGQRFLLFNVDWDAYEGMLSIRGNRPGLRMTYDQGTLELMTLSVIHEWCKKMLGRLIEALTLELDIPIRSGGSTTFRRKVVRRGLEPDECYWIQSEPLVSDKLDLDLERDPVPDLAVEVDITTSWLDRQSIYAALGVPEIWRFDGKTLRVFLRREDGEYEESPTSAAFPFLPIQEFARFLQFDGETNETARVRSFVKWVREQDFNFS